MSRIHQISAAFGQGRMYFASAEAAPLGVKPVLLYYGATALLAGLALIRTAGLTQENWPAGHGLSSVGWRDILYSEKKDILQLAVKATKGMFRHFVDTVWQGHIETVFFGRDRQVDTCPYGHRLGAIKFGNDGSCFTFAQLAARSRYTGGYYGSTTDRPQSLLRGWVWLNPKERPEGLHVSVDLMDRQGDCWLLDHARRTGLQLLGPDTHPYGAIFPRGDCSQADEPDIVPVFHYERSGGMSICESMPNGDRPNELLKLYLMAYIVGMLARYFPSQWLSVIRGTYDAPDTAVLVRSVAAVERNFVREFSAQLAVLCDDPHFFGDHFGYQARTVAPDWRCYVGGTGSGRPVFRREELAL